MNTVNISESHCLGRFPSTRHNLYLRIVFWLMAVVVFLAVFCYFIIIEPGVSVGTTMRSIIANATPISLLLVVFSLTFLVINCLRIFRSCNTLAIYREGLVIYTKKDRILRSYSWSQVESIVRPDRLMDINFSVPGHFITSLMSTVMLIVQPIRFELGLTGRTLRINTADQQHYYVDRRYPQREELTALLLGIAPEISPGVDRGSLSQIESDTMRWLRHMRDGTRNE